MLLTRVVCCARPFQSPSFVPTHRIYCQAFVMPRASTWREVMLSLTRARIRQTPLPKTASTGSTWLVGSAPTLPSLPPFLAQPHHSPSCSRLSICATMTAPVPRRMFRVRYGDFVPSPDNPVTAYPAVAEAADLGPHPHPPDCMPSSLLPSLHLRASCAMCTPSFCIRHSLSRCRSGWRLYRRNPQ